MLSRILLVVSGAFCLTLSSCIEGEETIWLMPDGSGRIEASYKLPPAVARKLGKPEKLVSALQEAALRDPHVELSRVTHALVKGGIKVHFAGTFDDLSKLASFPRRQLRDPENPGKRVEAEVLFGEALVESSARALSTRRSIDLGWLLEQTPAAKTIVKIPALLGDSSLRYVLHLPFPADETNATVRSEDGRRLEWQFALKDHVSTPMILSMSAHKSREAPKTPWILVLGGLCLLFLLQNKRARRKASE